MADVKDETETSNKEAGPSSMKFSMLTSSNYTVWAMRMIIALKVNKVQETIDPGSKHEEKNNMAITLIFQSILEALTLRVGNLDTAKTIWDTIQVRHVGAERVREAQLQTLMADFEKLKMKEEDSIDTFICKLTEILSKLASLGEIIEQPKLVKKFLKNLPRKKYIHMIASLEQVLDLNTTSFKDIVGTLKACEERISEEEEEQNDDHGKMMYASESQKENYANRGRERGGRSYWKGGRGRGRVEGFLAQKEAWKQSQNKDKSHITCFHCDKLGHYASECPDKFLKLQETVQKKDEDTQEADELMMHEVVYTNEKKVKPSDFEIEGGMENVWYLDNGARNHMSGNRKFFYKLDEEVTGKVRFGDD